MCFVSFSLCLSRSLCEPKCFPIHFSLRILFFSQYFISFFLFEGACLFASLYLSHVLRILSLSLSFSFLSFLSIYLALSLITCVFVSLIRFFQSSTLYCCLYISLRVLKAQPFHLTPANTFEIH